MTDAVIQILIGSIILAFTIARYVRLEKLAPVNAVWTWMESHVAFTKKYWFKLILVMIAIWYFALSADSIEGAKMGIGREEYSVLKQNAKDLNISIIEAKQKTEESKKSGFIDVKKYIEAAALGFTNFDDWKKAQSAGAKNEAEYEAVLALMKAKNLITIADYINFRDNEVKEKALAVEREKATIAKQEAEKVEASQVQTKNSSSATINVKESEYLSCTKYLKARDECATAAKVHQCIEIKIGESMAGLGRDMCN